MTLYVSPRRPPDITDYQARVNAAKAAGGPSRPPDTVKYTLPKRPSTSPMGSGKKAASQPNYAAMTDAQILALAEQQSIDAQAGERAQIASAQAAAAARALGGQQQAVGFAQAAGKMLSGIGASAGQPYTDAQNTLSGLGLTGPAAEFGSIDATAAGQQGAAASTWGGMLSSIQGSQAQHDLAALIAKGQTEQHDYEQQLIDLAAKRPDLKNQILDRLYQREMDKLNARLKIKTTDASLNQSERALALKERAQGDLEKAYGLKVQVAQDHSALGWASLKVKQGQYHTANQIAYDKLAQSGAQIDP